MFPLPLQQCLRLLRITQYLHQDPFRNHGRVNPRRGRHRDVCLRIQRIVDYVINTSAYYVDEFQAWRQFGTRWEGGERA